MKIVFFTIVLDGMPFITNHLPVFNRLSFDWQWRIAEGVALPVNCTRWCAPISPRVSIDGTSEYLRSIALHPNVTIYSKPSWNGKIEMVNTLTSQIEPGTLVVQVDSDELWDEGSIAALHRLMSRAPNGTHARFFCRYFVGPDLMISSLNTYGNKPDEWERAWKWSEGSRFISHEPPVVVPDGPLLHREKTVSEAMFDHYAYATEKQVEFKERYYRYPGAVEGWRRLQKVSQFPVMLRDYFPWVKDEATVIRATTSWLPF